MNKLFFGTSNQGKQEEISNFVETYGAEDLTIRFPTTLEVIEVPETGTTYRENALIKAKAYADHIGDKNLIYIGDDSGLRIPELNNEPGVYSRRWAGYEMSDEQILEFCLKKMRGLVNEKRKAVFETTLAVLYPNGKTSFHTGELWGQILEEPLAHPELRGFPFRATFWVDEVNCIWDDAVKLNAHDRRSFMTNREHAFKLLFESQENL